jgi:hypothetical protein
MLEKGSIFGRDLASLHCPIMLQMKTTALGYWQIKEN